jgi:hypothetical protein
MSKLFLTKWSFLFKLRLFLGLILLIVILIFFYFKIVPGGRAIYDLKWPRGLASGRGFIYSFRPGARIDITDKNGLKIITDPVYFTLFTPRVFDQATITVKYLDRLSTSTPLIRLGVLKNKSANSYDLQTIQNNRTDNYHLTPSSLAGSGGFKSAAATFDLHGAVRENGYYSWVISVPGLVDGNAENNYLEIKEIKIMVAGKNLWQNIQ